MILIQRLPLMQRSVSDPIQVTFNKSTVFPPAPCPHVPVSLPYLAVNLQVTRLFHDLLQFLVDLCTARTEETNCHKRIQSKAHGGSHRNTINTVLPLLNISSSSSPGVTVPVVAGWQAVRVCVCDAPRAQCTWVRTLTFTRPVFFNHWCAFR